MVGIYVKGINVFRLVIRINEIFINYEIYMVNLLLSK